MSVKYNFDATKKLYYIRVGKKRTPIRAKTIALLEDKLREKGLLIKYSVAEKNTMTVRAVSYTHLTLPTKRIV